MTWMCRKCNRVFERDEDKDDSKWLQAVYTYYGPECKECANWSENLLEKHKKKPLMENKKFQLKIEITKSIMDKLSRLIVTNDLNSITEVLSRSLALYETLAQIHHDEGKITLLLKDGNQKELIF